MHSKPANIAGRMLEGSRLEHHSVHDLDAKLDGSRVWGADRKGAAAHRGAAAGPASGAGLAEFAVLVLRVG